MKKYKKALPETVNLMELHKEIYAARYYANPSAWITEQTTYLLDSRTNKFKHLHKWQNFLLNGTYSTKLSVVLKCRQCLIEGSNIDLLDGSKIPIEFLHDNFYNGLGYKCKSLNEKYELEDDLIQDVWCVGKKETFELTTKNSKTITTEKHKFNTDNGFKELKDLKENDEIIINKNGKIYSEKIIDIKSNGLKKCYDLSTVKNHNYFTDDVSVHNSGISTAIAALMAHDVFFGLVPGVIFISASKQHAIELMDKFYKCMDSIVDPRFRVKYVRKTKQECEFINGCKVVSLSSNPKTMVGFTGCVVWDEAGRCDKASSEDIWNSIMPSITIPGTRMYVISTPFGKHNIFHKLCTTMTEETEAIQGAEDILMVPKRLIKVHYKDVPHVRNQIKLLRANMPNEAIWKMQYELEFGDDDTELLFPYSFLRDYAYIPEEETIEHSIKDIILKDVNGDYVNTGNILYG